MTWSIVFGFLFTIVSGLCLWKAHRDLLLAQKYLSEARALIVETARVETQRLIREAEKSAESK
jgi:hypothetical protein